MTYSEKNLDVFIPKYAPITRYIGRHIASQIMEAISKAVTKNYKANPPRFRGDIDEPFDPSLLRVINAANHSSAEYGRELPDFLKIQYGERGNVCHIQLQPNGTAIKVNIDLFGWPLRTEQMQRAAANAIEERGLTLDNIVGATTPST